MNHDITKRNNLNTDAFTVIEELSLPGQKVALRAICNSAICGAVFLAHAAVSWDGPTEDDGTLTPSELRQLEFYERLPHLLSQKAELYSVAATRLSPLVLSQYDKQMQLDDAIEFAMNNAGGGQVPTDLPDELLAAMGISREQLKLIDEAEAKRRVAQDRKLRESVRIHEHNIRNELKGLLHEADKLGEEEAQATIDTLDSATHTALFAKVAAKLSAGVAQALAKRDRYDGAIADAMLISADIKVWDKAYRTFLRENAGDQASERAAA